MIILVAAAVFVWLPRGKKVGDTPPPAFSASLNQPISMVTTEPRKRTEFVGWPRDPFVKPQTKENQGEKTGGASGLKLGAIMWDDKNPSAFINGKFVNVGDKIENKTVKQIERDRVILTDGTNEYVLKLDE